MSRKILSISAFAALLCFAAIILRGRFGTLITNSSKEGARIKAGEVFENPVTGERAVVRIGTEQNNGELLVADLYIRLGGAVMGEHLHPSLEERFTVLRGRVGFRLSGRMSTAEPGVTLDGGGLLRFCGHQIPSSKDGLGWPEQLQQYGNLPRGSGKPGAARRCRSSTVAAAEVLAPAAGPARSPNSRLAQG